MYKLAYGIKMVIHFFIFNLKHKVNIHWPKNLFSLHKNKIQLFLFSTLTLLKTLFGMSDKITCESMGWKFNSHWKQLLYFYYSHCLLHQSKFVLNPKLQNIGMKSNNLVRNNNNKKKCDKCINPQNALDTKQK